jgi:hypothetical protein
MQLHWSTLADLSVFFPPFNAAIPVAEGVQVRAHARRPGPRLAARRAGESRALAG